MTNNNEDGISRANFKYLFRELALDSATRKAGGILIIIGSSLGVLFGLFLISADPSEIISGQFDYDEDRADISGIFIALGSFFLFSSSKLHLFPLGVPFLFINKFVLVLTIL